MITNIFAHNINTVDMSTQNVSNKRRFFADKPQHLQNLHKKL